MEGSQAPDSSKEQNELKRLCQKMADLMPSRTICHIQKDILRSERSDHLYTQFLAQQYIQNTLKSFTEQIKFAIMYKAIGNATFLHLRKFQLTQCHHLLSLELLAAINAPVLEQIFISDCLNIVSLKPLVKLQSRSINTVSIDNKNQRIIQISFEHLHRVKLNKNMDLSHRKMVVFMYGGGILSGNQFIKLELQSQNNKSMKVRSLEGQFAFNKLLHQLRVKLNRTNDDFQANLLRKISLAFNDISKN